MWEQDKPIIQEIYIHWPWNFYHSTNTLTLGYHKNFIANTWSIFMNLKLERIDIFLQQKLSTKTCHIIVLLHRSTHKNSKTSSFSFLWFFSMIYYELLKFEPNYTKKKKKNHIRQTLCAKAPGLLLNQPLVHQALWVTDLHWEP